MARMFATGLGVGKAGTSTAKAKAFGSMVLEFLKLEPPRFSCEKLEEDPMEFIKQIEKTV